MCKWQEKTLCEKRKQELSGQFKSMIESVSSSLQAGYSAENAFIRTKRELSLLYKKEADILIEVENMTFLLQNNVTLEEILMDFGIRSSVDDIRNFAEVFGTGKRSGGDFREIICSCVELLSEKADTEREIRTLIHAKVLEQKVMCLVPFCIMGYISLTSPGYFSPLYHNAAGICIMSLCLLIYAGVLYFSWRITQIEV